MNYETNIDTIGLRIRHIDTNMQLNTIITIESYLNEQGLFIKNINIDTKENEKYKRCLIKEAYFNKHKICTITSGYAPSAKMYYVNITFAGLRRHIKEIDDISENIYTKTISHINTHKIEFEIRQLDICLDIFEDYQDVLSICKSRIQKTNYYRLTEKQKYSTCKYIEKFKSKEQMKEALRRAYLYCKTTKEGLDNSITRFEIKYQWRFFRNHDLESILELIKKDVERYLVLHFKDRVKRDTLIRHLKKLDKVDTRAVKKYKLENYRVKFDTYIIEQKLTDLYTMRNEGEYQKIVYNDYIIKEKEKIAQSMNTNKRLLNDATLEVFNTTDNNIDTSMLKFK